MDTLLSTALDAARAAGRIHLEHFGEVRLEEVREKAHSDFVSEVDLEAQTEAVRLIRSRFPDHRILAEEVLGDGAAPAPTRSWPPDGTPVWIIDPLDGTTNYLHGHPHFAASVAVGRLTGAGGALGEKDPGGSAVGRVGEAERATGFFGQGLLEAGAVVAARTGDCWWARRGEGAWKNGERIRVSAVRNLGKALVGTGFPFKAPHLVPRYVGQLARVLPASGGVRRCGSAALDLCYLAEGVLDAFWEEDYLSPWDVAAGLLVLEEAGGHATRLDGRPLDLEDGSVLASNSQELSGMLGRLVRGG